MIKKFSLMTAFVFAAGCSGQTEQLTANFQYSNAGNLGTQNAGLFEPGSLFLWDTVDNQLSFLDVIPLTPVGGTPAPADVLSSNVAAIELSGVPVGADEDLLRASVGAQSTFTAKSAVREDYGRLISALAAYATDLLEQGADPDLVLGTREAGVRLVLVRSVVRAASSELRIGGVDATKPNSVVEISLGDSLSVSVRAGSSTACSKPVGNNDASSPVCFFNVSVFDPEYLEGNPRLQFLPRSSDGSQLSTAFRRLR